VPCTNDVRNSAGKAADTEPDVSYEVDFLWRDAQLVVEVDGYAFHRDRAAFERDRRRDAALMAAGLRVMRFTWRQIVEEPLPVIARIAQVLGG
jgi:very-short-patch-repair endonuclease